MFESIKGGYLDKADIDNNKSYLKQMISLDIEDKYIRLEAGSLSFMPELKEAVYTMKNEDEYTFGSIRLISFDGFDINKHISIIYKHKDKPSLISISPTYVSMDGEYRHNILLYNNLKKIIDKNLPYITDIVVDLFNTHSIKLHSYKTDVDAKIIFTIFYAINYAKFYGNSGNIHSVIDFKKLYIGKVDVEKDNLYHDLMILCFQNPKSKTRAHLALGCKMIPLLISDIKSNGALYNNVWSEHYINKVVNSIILNGKTRHLPYSFHRSYLNTKKYLDIYDNKEQLKRMNNSIIGNKLVRELTKAKELLVEDSGNFYINSYFETVGKTIENSVSITEDLLQYSEESMLFFTQHRGLTLHTLLHQVKNGLLSSACLPIDHIQNTFRLAHALFCLNESGIIHLDLHLNNIVYMREKVYPNLKGYSVYSLPKKGGKRLKKRAEIDEANILNGKSHIFDYEIDEQEVYYSEDLDYCLTIIDFGRSIINYEFDNDEDLMKYEASRKMRILNTYKAFYPEFYEKNKRHLYFEIDRFDLFFNKCAALDILRYLTMVIESEALLQIPDDKVFMKMLKMKHFMEDFLLTTEVRKENPNLLLIRTFFKKYLKKPVLQGHDFISHVFCAQAPMHYDLSDYHNFPPFLKVFNMEKIHEFTGKPSRIAIEKDLYEKNKKDIDKIKISLL